MPATPAPPTAVASLEGLWLPIVTPFTADGDLDEASLHNLATKMLSDGVTGLVALGTTGEPATMTATERRRVVEICDAACVEADRHLIIGAGTNSTAGTIDEISHLCAGTNAAATLIVVPYYTRPSQEAVVTHFTTVADASPVPLVLYNIPYRTGRGLDAASLLRAGAHTNVIGLKQAVGAIDADTLGLLSAANDNFGILAGDDAFIAPTVLMGGAGAIAAAAHMCTPEFVYLVTAASGGNVPRSVALAEALLPVVEAGFAEPSPAVWKGALAAGGTITSNRVRRPLAEASPESVARLLAAADLAKRQALLAE